jgi:thioredoxin reductase
MQHGIAATEQSIDVLVIGAGMAGLMAVRELQRSDGLALADGPISGWFVAASALCETDSADWKAEDDPGFTPA